MENSDGRNLLHKAVSEHNLLILQKDNCGISSLQLAVLLGDLEITKHLLSSINENVAISAISNSSGRTLLHSSIAKQHFPITSLLIKWKPALVKATDKYGWTALHLAASLGDITSLQLLLENGSDLGQLTAEKLSAGLIATQDEQPACVRFLLEYGFDTENYWWKETTPDFSTGELKYPVDYIKSDEMQSVYTEFLNRIYKTKDKLSK
jgi:ankyrin repeat protein